MIERNQIDRFLETSVKIELSNNTYLKGILREVGDKSIVLEFFDGRKIAVSLSSIEFVKEADV